jgi:hypothetical protein
MGHEMPVWMLNLGVLMLAIGCSSTPTGTSTPPSFAVICPAAFTDDFTATSLGPSWIVGNGAFTESGDAAHGIAPGSYAFWNGNPDANAPVTVTLGPPVSPTYYGVTVRADTAVPVATHYAGFVGPDMRPAIASRNGYTYSYLGFGQPVSPGTHTLTLTANGMNPVMLALQVDGATVLTVTDSSAQAHASGRAGIFDFNGSASPLEHFVVGSTSCACTPTTCAAHNATCGSIPDGCGGMLDCGPCPAGTTCGGGGVPNQCGSACIPTTCAAHNATCGSIPDGCGGMLDCGPCPVGTTCGGGGVPNQCGGSCLAFTDDFTGTSLGPSWIVGKGTFTESSDAAHGTAPGSYAFWNGSPDANAPVTVTLGPPVSPTYYGVTVRADTTVPVGAHYAGYVGPDMRPAIASRNAYAYSYLGFGQPVSPGAHTLTLTATGTNPVRLTLQVDGTTVITATDSSAQAHASGRTGIFDFNGSGSPLEHFIVGSTSSCTTPPPDLGTPPPDLGTPPPDLGTPPPDLGTPPPPDMSGTPNPVVLENARPGSGNWQLNNSANNHEVEGYASLTSVPRGGRIQFYVNSNEPSYTIQIFRLGWYGGAGGRAMTQPVTRTTVAQPSCPMDPSTGRVECNWTDPYVLDVPAPADASNWASGMYVAHVTANSTGHDVLIRFVVRDDVRRSAYLAQSSVSTAQAYNAWGGKSLYDFNSTGGRASQVSYNRPLDLPNADGYELSMLRFLEREGYDVSYSSSLDTHENGAQIRQHKAWFPVGHDEYWSTPMRNSVESARDVGVHLAFFAANTSFWQVRFAPSPVSGAADRTMICYKDASLDPQAQSTTQWLTTVHFRDPLVNRPENQMIGVMWQYDPVDADLVVINTTHWVFAGTGLHDGDHLHRLLGGEVDAVFADIHPGLVRLGNSPYVTSSGTTQFANMAIYTASSNAIVFATGTIWWSYGLDDYWVQDRLSPAAQQITRNVLARFTQ